MQILFTRSTAAIALIVVSPAALADAASSSNKSSDDLVEITVTAKRVANDAPASTYASVAAMIRYDPLTELQSRGIAEGQSDVAVRGGLFENTGFKLGAIEAGV